MMSTSYRLRLKLLSEVLNHDFHTLSTKREKCFCQLACKLYRPTLLTNDSKQRIV